MNILKNYFLYLSLFLLSLSPLAGKEDFRIEEQPLALEATAKLPHTGVLKQKENGFVYLDVSNGFIDEVVPLLEIPGKLSQRPTALKSMGAHISVFNEKEGIVPQELGQTFSFEAADIRSFTLNTRDGLKKLWALSVHAPELERLRASYGLSPLMKGHAYHITLGKQLPTAPENWESVETVSPFNFSVEPVLGMETAGSFVKVPCQEALDTVGTIQGLGKIRLKGNGFVWVDVDNAFVENVLSALPLEGTFTPISTKPKQMGAHISVFYEDELIGNEIWDFAEAGQWFAFEVKEVRYVARKTPQGNERLWLLAVDAPGLQRLRMHYGLKPKLQGHDFHITIGHEKLEAKEMENAVPEAA